MDTSRRGLIKKCLARQAAQAMEQLYIMRPVFLGWRRCVAEIDASLAARQAAWALISKPPDSCSPAGGTKLSFEHCATLGRQHYFVSNAETRALLKKFGLSHRKIFRGCLPSTYPDYSEPFWEMLGARTLADD